MLELANAWQRGFPLTSRPFAEIGRRCELAEHQVLAQFLELKTRGLIDRVGPVFRPNTVGASTLAAMAVPPERLAEVAALVSAERGVNHNYEREHSTNLWFVATGASEAQVQATLQRIGEASGIRVLALPLLEEFHIDLGFDLETHAAPRERSPCKARPLSGEEKALVAAVAAGLPLAPAPYAALAKAIGCSESAVIGLLEDMLADGRIRRIGAVIRHRSVGYHANAMAVWNVPDEEAAQRGRALGRDPAVTLCYRRARALPEWPYNLYCMVHGRSRGRVVYELKRLSAAHGLGRFPGAVLFSKRCFAQRAAAYG
jgi:DNA-binding Lrp family transcriptional regulator